MPASFDFASVFAPDTPVDIFIPWPLLDKAKTLGKHGLKIVGRLEARRHWGRPAAGRTHHAGGNNWKPSIQSGNFNRSALGPVGTTRERRSQAGSVRARLRGVGVVMLIVCVNLSNLQLARLGHSAKGNGATDRARSRTFPTACDRCLRRAWRSRVAVPCWDWSSQSPARGELAHVRAFKLPLLESVRIDGKARSSSPCWQRSLPAYSLACCRRYGSRAVSLREGMQDGRPRSERRQAPRLGSATDWWFPKIAFACILLVGAGLLIRSFLRVLRREPGISAGSERPRLRIDPSFRIIDYRPAELLYRRCAEPRPFRPWHHGGRDYRRTPAARTTAPSVFAARGQVYQKGHQPGGVHSHCERWVFRRGRSSVAAGQRIYGAGSRIRRTRRGGQ